MEWDVSEHPKGPDGDLVSMKLRALTPDGIRIAIAKEYNLSNYREVRRCPCTHRRNAEKAHNLEIAGSSPAAAHTMGQLAGLQGTMLSWQPNDDTVRCVEGIVTDSSNCCFVGLPFPALHGHSRQWQFVPWLLLRRLLQGI